jgi:hypothetical protein
MGLIDYSDRIEQQVTRAQEQYEKIRSRFYEPQLAALGLGIDQLRGQPLEILHRRLESVNDAISDPSSFGVLRVKFTADAGVVIATSADESHVEVSALPILLERKRMIVERIADLGGAEKIENIRDVEEVTALQAHQARAEEDLKIQRGATMLQIEAFERKSQVWQSFLERESIASIVGAVLLVALAVTLVMAMFIGTNPSEVVTNSFLIILGYFFGQTTSRRSPTGA